MAWELIAGCKVNLYLDIVGVRQDGYHEIESLFYPVPAPFDTIRVEETSGEGMRLTCSDPGLATDANILARAYGAFARATGFAPGLAVHLEKGIPMGAGLGGGSSDAAAMLRWLNDKAGELALPGHALSEIALSLGADVPFFLHGEPAWVTGIGERIERVHLDLSGYALLVICPAVHVNTAWAYRRWDEMHAEGLVQSRKELTPKNSLIKSLCFTKPPVLWNCFESVVFLEFPVLYELKEQVLDHAADACVMSGSGSSFVALFSTPADARRCACAMSACGHSCYGIYPDGTDGAGS